MLVSTSSNAYEDCKSESLTNDRDEKESSIIDINNKLQVYNSPEAVVGIAPEPASGFLRSSLEKTNSIFLTFLAQNMSKREKESLTDKIEKQ
jgi:hypothetical protein